MNPYAWRMPRNFILDKPSEASALLKVFITRSMNVIPIGNWKNQK
jgi:hypothetical protein